MADFKELFAKNMEIAFLKRAGVYTEPPKPPDTRTIEQKFADMEKRLGNLESTNYGRALSENECRCRR